MAIGRAGHFGFNDATASFLARPRWSCQRRGLIFSWVADRFGRTRPHRHDRTIFVASLGRPRAIGAAVVLACVLGWHGRRVGVRRRPRQRNVAARPPQQGHQHHAVGWALGYIMALLAAVILGRWHGRMAGCSWPGCAGALHTVGAPERARAGSWVQRHAAVTAVNPNPFKAIFTHRSRPDHRIICSAAPQFAYWGVFSVPRVPGRPLARAAPDGGVVARLDRDLPGGRLSRLSRLHRRRPGVAATPSSSSWWCRPSWSRSTGRWPAVR